MIYQIVAVHDTATQAYMRPFFTHTTLQAIRTFQNEVKREANDNPLYTNPTDFALYHIGTFDDANGRGETFPQPALLIRAADIKE